MPCRLSVNTHQFTLTDTHATDVSANVLTAVRDGGGYVHIVPLDGSETDILVTPATTIIFERISVVKAQPARIENDWSDADVWPGDFV